MSKIAFLGTGAMGSRMVMSLIKAGHEVTVWNRDPAKLMPLREAGARASDTPAHAVANAEFVVCMVRDDVASRDVWMNESTGALAAMPKNAVAIDSSTLTYEWVRELHKNCTAHGIAMIDAPVAGTRPQAEAAQLIYFVGGDEQTLARAEPVLKAMGSTIHHAGPAGAGAAIKLAINALFASQLATLAELLSFMERCKLDLAKSLDIIGSNSSCSPSAKAAAAAMFAGNFAPNFPVELVEKDLGYALDTANAVGAPMPMVIATRDVYAAAVEAGHGNLNSSAVAKLYR